MCVAGGLRDEDLEAVQNVVHARRRVKAGEKLFRASEDFAAVYASRCGFFKTSATDGNGREQVTGFQVSGELLGMEGMACSQQSGTALALEDSEVCVMHKWLIESAGDEYRALQRRVEAALAREMVRTQGMMMLLGSSARCAQGNGSPRSCRTFPGV